MPKIIAEKFAKKEAITFHNELCFFNSIMRATCSFEKILFFSKSRKQILYLILIQKNVKIY